MNRNFIGVQGGREGQRLGHLNVLHALSTPPVMESEGYPEFTH